MKLVTVTIRPHELDAVRHGLERHAVLGMTISEIERAGSARTEVHRGSAVVVDLAPAFRVESVLHDELVDRVVDEVVERLGTGSEARLTVQHVDYVERVRTGERGSDAV